MTHPIAKADDGAPARIDDCWNKIGVRGDGSCPLLKQHVHCRNCPIYSAAAVGMLNERLPAGYEDEWAAHFTQTKKHADTDSRSVVIFRLGQEWLALPTSSVEEIADQRPIHSLPHRQSKLVLGVANVRGELVVCVALGELLGVETSMSKQRGSHRTTYPRLLVIRGADGRFACPVDEVHGTHRFSARTLQPPPETVAKASVTYTETILRWNDRIVGCLDSGLLSYALSRGLV